MALASALMDLLPAIAPLNGSAALIGTTVPLADLATAAEPFSPSLIKAQRRRQLPPFSSSSSSHLLASQRWQGSRVEHSSVSIAVRTRGGAAARSTSSSPFPSETTTSTATSSVALARMSLTAVAALYATMNVCLRSVYTVPDPPAAPVIGVIRGVFAALCFAPSLVRLLFMPEPPRPEKEAETNGGRRALLAAENKSSRRGTSSSLWKDALDLGLWNVASTGLLTAGLSLASSSVRASFLAQTSVIITPILSMLAGQKVEPSLWAGAAVAMVGLYLLATADGGGIIGEDAVVSVSGDHNGAATNIGDLLVLGCAVCWSMYLHRFSAVADRHDKISLQAATCGIRAILYAVWFGVAAAIRYFVMADELGGWDGVAGMWRGWRNIRVWVWLLFSAVGAGAVAGMLQQRGQEVLSAAEANIILSIEPIFAGLFAWALLGELMSPRENLGGFIIFLAAVVCTGIFDGLLSSIRAGDRQ